MTFRKKIEADGHSTLPSICHTHPTETHEPIKQFNNNNNAIDNMPLRYKQKKTFKNALPQVSTLST